VTREVAVAVVAVTLDSRLLPGTHWALDRPRRAEFHD
jgi:hypothetical protein